MCAKSGGDAIGAPLLSIGCRPPSKRLNIVLDLNGVLCQCEESSGFVPVDSPPYTPTSPIFFPVRSQDPRPSSP